jgi:RES domain-containing protein
VVHDPRLLDALEQFEAKAWEGSVFRHVLGPYAPNLANVRGARWNPPEVSALYVSLEEETARAEGDRVLAIQSVPPRVTRSIYELAISLESVLDLTGSGQLEAVGLTAEDLQGDSFEPCQRVGAAVSWVGHDGLLVPSARRDQGKNLVIYTANQAPESEIETRQHWTIESDAT